MSGSATANPGTSSATPAVSATATAETLGVGDGGTTVRVVTGQRITVVLGPAGPWDPPVARGTALVRISSSGGYPTSLPARAVFLAVRPGTARLTSTTDARCLHARPSCSIPQRLWQVTVIVAGTAAG